MERIEGMNSRNRFTLIFLIGPGRGFDFLFLDSEIITNYTTTRRRIEALKVLLLLLSC
jgi:hypothetical protein